MDELFTIIAVSVFTSIAVAVAVVCLKVPW